MEEQAEQEEQEEEQEKEQEEEQEDEQEEEHLSVVVPSGKMAVLGQPASPPQHLSLILSTVCFLDSPLLRSTKIVWLNLGDTRGSRSRRS